MFFAKISGDPHAREGGSFVRISARRSNGDKVYIFGETVRQVKQIRRMLMKLARHYGDLPMIFCARFPRARWHPRHERGTA
jgi:hypothetical protein